MLSGVRVSANTGVKPMWFQCWASVADGSPTLKPHWVNVSYLLGKDKVRLRIAPLSLTLALTIRPDSPTVGSSPLPTPNPGSQPRGSSTDWQARLRTAGDDVRMGEPLQRASDHLPHYRSPSQSAWILCVHQLYHLVFTDVLPDPAAQ